MTQYLDLESWARREVFEFYRNFDKPYFNVCVRLDITKLLSYLREHTLPGSKANVSLAYHYFALRVANETEPFHYRLRDGKAVIDQTTLAGTTVLVPSGSFVRAYFDYHVEFAKFIVEA